MAKITKIWIDELVPDKLRPFPPGHIPTPIEIVAKPVDYEDLLLNEHKTIVDQIIAHLLEVLKNEPVTSIERVGRADTPVSEEE